MITVTDRSVIGPEADHPLYIPADREPLPLPVEIGRKSDEKTV
jgi:hypothetical protein